MTPDEAREISERTYNNKVTTKRFEDKVKIDIAIREAAHDGRTSCRVVDIFEPGYFERQLRSEGWDAWWSQSDDSLCIGWHKTKAKTEV